MLYFYLHEPSPRRRTDVVNPQKLLTAEYKLLDCNDVVFGGSSPMFRRNIPPLTSGQISVCRLFLAGFLLG
jgi:hypothetical protein